MFIKLQASVSIVSRKLCYSSALPRNGYFCMFLPEWNASTCGKLQEVLFRELCPGMSDSSQTSVARSQGSISQRTSEGRKSLEVDGRDEEALNGHTWSENWESAQ